MLQNTTSLGEIVLRVSCVYAGLLVMVRMAGKREIGEMGPLDLLVMLILSETVSPALTGGDSSLVAAGVAAGTLIVLASAVGWLTYSSRLADRLIEGSAKVVVQDGHIDRALCAEERISEEDLAAALREHNTISLKDVTRATLERNGRISVVTRKDP